MIKLEIFDPAMCCSTGVCGPSIDPELLRVSTVVNNLNKKGIFIKRYNLSEEPGEYVKNKDVSMLLRSKGVSALPLTLLDGAIVKSGTYPTNNEFSSWLGVNEDELSTRNTKEKSCCGNDSGCC